MKNEALICLAKEAMKQAYAPYSNFQVGAALLSADGAVYTGCNVENASYSAGCCAERTALFKAVSEGARDFVKIAVVSADKKPAYPCGICRQVLSEFGQDITVVVEEDGKAVEYRLSNLLPHQFVL
jgi:cytidine deaminase